MSRRPARFRGFGTGCLLAAALGGSAHGASLEDLIPAEPSQRFQYSARDIVARAFENLYECDLAQRVELVTRTSAGVTREQEVSMLRKRIEGRAHQLLDYRTPGPFYGLRFLKIERDERSDDHFMYVPELQRIRRFTSAQRADQVQGTDLSFEDLEFRRVEQFDFVARDLEQLDGEWVEVVTVDPHRESGYERADLYIEPVDWVIREVHYYRKGDVSPFKTIEAPRDEMRRYGDHVMPGRWIVTDFERRSRTDVVFTHTAVNPELEDGLFTSVELENRRLLPEVGR